VPGSGGMPPGGGEASGGPVDLSVVILSYNTRPLLEACLASLRAATEEGRGPRVEVIVVDNASTDDSVRVVRDRFPEVRLIESETNRGFAGGNNLAFPYCRGRYVMLLNSDTELEPDGLAAMVGFMDAHPEAGALGPRLLNPDGTFQPSGHPFPSLSDAAFRLLFRRPLAPTPGSRRGKTRFHRAWSLEPGAWSCPEGAAERHDWVTGACLMVRREVLEQVGPLDEAFFFEGEDVDWCRRIRAAGWEIGLLPAARVMHLRQGSGMAYHPDALRSHWGHCYYFRKYHGRGAEMLMQMLFSCFHLLGWLKYSIRFWLRRRDGDHLKQRVHRLGIGYFLRRQATGADRQESVG
jgi:N-acetylglucosaminyl-diphospho-decaprenol L-rhamnosyltransferase